MAGPLPLLPLARLPLLERLLQCLGCTHLVPPKDAVEHGRQHHGAVGVLLREAYLGVFPAAVFDNADGAVEEISADALATVSKASGPCPDDAFAAPEADASAPVPASAAPGRQGGEARLQPEDQHADQGTAVASADDEVSFDALGSLEPRPPHVLRQLHVAVGEVAYCCEIRHGYTAGQQKRQAGVSGRGRIGQSIDARPGHEQEAHAQRVEDHGAGGPLFHLGDRVGYEVQAGYFVVVREQWLQGQWRHIVESIEGGIGIDVGIRRVGGV